MYQVKIVKDLKTITLLGRTKKDVLQQVQTLNLASLFAEQKAEVKPLKVIVEAESDSNVTMVSYIDNKEKAKEYVKTYGLGEIYSILEFNNKVKKYQNNEGVVKSVQICKVKSL